jgi:hypothetical protein
LKKQKKINISIESARIGTREQLLNIAKLQLKINIVTDNVFLNNANIFKQNFIKIKNQQQLIQKLTMKHIKTQNQPARQQTKKKNTKYNNKTILTALKSFARTP